MIAWFYKYGFVLLLLNTILYSIPETNIYIAPTIFYFLMGTGLILLIINPSQIKDVILHRSFLFLLLINLINLLYFIFFEDVFNQQSLEFLMARFVQFFIISLSVYHNYDYYKTKFPNLIVKIISFVIIISLVVNPDLFSDRYHGIIWNPNMLASLSFISFSFLFLKTKTKTTLDIFLLILFFIVSIATGSALALLMIVCVFIFKFGFSIRNMIYGIMGLSLLFVVSNADLKTSFNRVSFDKIYRTSQISLAIENLNEKLWFGYGLSVYDGNIVESKIREKYEEWHMASHNGYLSLLLQYGLIVGSLVIIIIFRKSGILFLHFFRKERSYNIYLFIIFVTFVATFFESLITGINEFQTLLFWFSLSYLSYSKYLQDYEN